jgi:hypothetical protein
VSNSKSFIDESPFLEAETFLVPPEDDNTSLELYPIETPFLSADPNYFVQVEQ